MYCVNDKVVYKKDVCVIDEIKKINGNDYYTLIPVNDNSLKISVLTDSLLIRDIISKEEILKIIGKIPTIKLIEDNDRLMESNYKKLMLEGSYESLISIIKTTYLRNLLRLNNGKRLSEKDSFYFNEAEKYLYTEFSYALNKSYDETKEFIVAKLQKYEDKNEE